uniref:Reverse transcriptase domain, reverse transcriptase zinc-binding domain protein n=1 Tax=Tanacetum cinerariifolium TaxID=118510 RepID=A0A6L2KDL6_TANCI|nr:reverse transcriptase domain, reverse transcriptase zinc-binding domain protein [Tanacetum cinerariifolium]
MMSAQSSNTVVQITCSQSRRPPVSFSLYHCYGRSPCEWSRANIRNITSILECFHRVSGLKINLHKSNLVGIGVSFDEVKILSQITGCNATHSSFKYLGLPVDCNMAISKSWDPLIEKFSKRLSKWKASLLSIALRDRLPTRWNLSRKGIELDTLLCPICDSNIETVDHTFWTCSLATSIWNKIFDWLDIDAPSPVHIQDIFTWINDLRVSTTKKSILEVICGVALWALWQFRNGLVFGSSPSNRCTLFDSIIDTSYRWYSIRNKLSSISWNNWMLNPLL